MVQQQRPEQLCQTAGPGRLRLTSTFNSTALSSMSSPAINASLRRSLPISAGLETTRKTRQNLVLGHSWDKPWLDGSASGPHYDKYIMAYS